MKWLRKIWNNYQLQRSIANIRTSYYYDKGFIHNCFEKERRSRETIKDKYRV